MSNDSGTLYVVATPIGNLGDISARAIKVLSGVGMIAAEDTRRAGQLLTHLGLRKRLISLHEHNESERVDEIMAALSNGTDVALISDSGTPLISDPGYRLLAALREARIPVAAVPGCSAVLAALSVAGLPTDRFRFEGFLPPRRQARRTRLGELADCPDTLVCFESAQRIEGTLDDMAELFGAARPMAAGRELTKLHETLYRGTIDEVRHDIDEDPGSAKGEYTLVIAGSSAAAAPDAAELERVVGILLGELAPARAAALAARITGATRGEAYAAARRVRDVED